MTQKLYFENQYIKDFTAEIINIFEKDGEFHIELDKTAFFPGGGGQPFDTGSIEDCTISHVYEKDGIIYHVSHKKPIKIHRAKCSIDWDFRFDGMQQHLGQHILSSAFLEALGCNTVSFHLGRDFCTTDIDKILTDEELQKAEELANRIVFLNKRVDFLTPSKSELKKMQLRRVPEIKENSLRVVKIEDTDMTACCGIHPQSTLEVQMIKITGKTKAKGNLRVEYICGRRAVEESLNKYKFSNKVCRDLNCNEEEAIIRINKLTLECSSLFVQNEALKSQIADFEIRGILENSEIIAGVRIVKNVLNNADAKYANLMATKLTSYENVIALYGYKSDGIGNLIFMCSKTLKGVSMNDLLKDAITLVDGKGGGSTFLAKGGGKGINNLEAAVDYAASKAKNLLLSRK